MLIDPKVMEQSGKAMKWLSVIFVILTITGIVTSCIREDREQKVKAAEELRKWENSPEHSFRFCITTAAGLNGTVTPEQIAACNKAAGR